jgi:MFS family permease
LRASRVNLRDMLGPAISLSFSAFLVMFAEAMLYPSLPVIQAEFNITQAGASWIFTSYLIAGSLATLIIGRLADIHGKKRLLLIVQSLFGIALILNSLAPTYSYFIGVRALQGLGMAVAPLAYAIIKEQFPSKKAPVAQGLVSAMTGIGLITALPLGGWVTDHLGWRMNFTVAAFMIVPAVIANALILKDDKVVQKLHEDASLNLAGLVLFAAFIVPLLIAVSTVYSEAIPTMVKIALLIMAGVAFTLFWLKEKRSTRPLIPLRILNRNVKVAIVDAFGIAVSFQMDIFALAYLLQSPKPSGYGLSPLETGVYMVVIILAYALSAPLAGHLIPLLGPKRVASLGALLASIGYIVVAYNPVNNLYTVLSMLSLGSAGRALLNTSLVSLVTFSVEKGYLATATSLYSLMRNLGSALGPIISGLLLTLYSTHNVMREVAGVEATLLSSEAYTSNYLIISLIFALVFISTWLISDIPIKSKMLLRE